MLARLRVGMTARMQTQEALRHRWRVQSTVHSRQSTERLDGTSAVICGPWTMDHGLLR